jgi:hypothetical protein
MENSNSKTGLPIGSLVLDEDTANTISRMLKSSDAENYPIAQNLILRVDLKKGINWYYLYKICSERSYIGTISERMINRRTKAGREFEKIFNPRLISMYQPARLLRTINSLDLLDAETMDKIKPLIIVEITSNLKRTIYPKIVDFEMVFKEDYAKHLESNNPTKIKE